MCKLSQIWTLPFRRRSFGKDIFYKKTYETPVSKFEKDDVKFLHELLISYGPELPLEERIKRFEKDHVVKTNVLW